MSDVRKIYKYHDGRGKVHADPLVIHRKLIRACGGDPAGVFELTQAKLTRLPNAGPDEPSQVELPQDVLHRVDGEERWAKVAVETFGLLPFDPATGQGMTEAEQRAVIDDWCGWMEKNEAPAESSATSSPVIPG